MSAARRTDRRRNRAHAWGALALLAAATACDGAGESGEGGAKGGNARGAPDAEASAPAAGPAWFEEAAREVGLAFEHDSGHVAGPGERFYFPEVMSTGVALFDADGDGDLDAYAVQGGSLTGGPDPARANALFENGGDGTFTDVSRASGTADSGFGMGVATGDYDGDGDLDLYVTNLGANVLYRNDGGMRFTDVTDAAGVAGSTWSSGAAFTDYDGDGDLDLFVANYVYWSLESDPVCQHLSRVPTYCGPITYEAPTPDTLFRNDGDGRFTDVSESTGISARRGNGLGVLCLDVDADGRSEIFVANDGTPNHLWCFDGKRFDERARELGCAVDNLGAPKAGMGVAAADVDRDGDEDLLVVNLHGETDSLFRNDGGRFMDRTIAAGLPLPSRMRTRFGVGLVDFDHDGHLDCYQANGRVHHELESPADDPLAEDNLLLAGTARGRFEEVAPLGGVLSRLVATSRAAAFGDVDGDGDVDVLVHNKDGPLHYLRNVAPKRGAAATLRVIGASGGDALGARVRVRARGAVSYHEVRTSSSYCAGSSPAVHVGLGDARAIDEVSVAWPSGATERFGPLDAGRTHALVEGEGERVE